MPNFKSFFIVVTNGNKWGKSVELARALKAAYVTSKTEYVIFIGIVKGEASEAQVKNLSTCFNVNDFGNVEMYYEPSEEDKQMVKDLFVGWVTDSSFVKVTSKVN